MKKLLFILGIVCTALVIAGCGSETAETTEETTQEEVAAEETTEVVEQPAVEETGAEEVVAEETVVEEATETAEEAAAEEETGTEEVAAESTETIEVEGCDDSDGGRNYEVAGDIVDARGTTDFDRCSENENYPGRLYESYCGEDGKRIRETYDCPSNKCSAGACVAAEESAE